MLRVFLSIEMKERSGMMFSRRCQKHGHSENGMWMWNNLSKTELEGYMALKFIAADRECNAVLIC